MAGETKGLEVLGFFCWWMINEVKMPREKFNELAKSVGLEVEIPEPKLRTTFLKAIREVKKVETRQHLLIRKISKKADEYTFGLVDEEVNVQDATLGYTQQATLQFSPEHGNLTTDHPHRAFDEIKKRYEEYQNNIDSDDVRSWILNLLASEWRISVRSRGGIYFLPVRAEELTDRLEKLLGLLPGDCEFMVAPQIDVERSRNAIAKAFNAELKSKIASFREEIKEKKEKSSDRKATKCWNDRIAEFKSLKDQISFYADALKFQGDTLIEDLSSLETEVKTAFLKA